VRYTPVRFHLVRAILSDPAGEWTIREMTRRVAAKVHVPSGAVQDSLYVMLADNLLEAVPFQRELTLRLRHDTSRPRAPLAKAAGRLTVLLYGWRPEHRAARQQHARRPAADAPASAETTLDNRKVIAA
jgi:hypothetical protein